MRALITGITGQDGRYLSEFLDARGYEVFGLIRGQSNPKTALVQSENPRLNLVQGDLTDLGSLVRVLDTTQPDEIYHLGAMSHVGHSFNHPELTANVTALGTLRMLEAVRASCPSARFYQASSSEQFGNEPAPQSESTPFRPRSPYGAAKVFAHNITINYRDAHDLHTCCGILFNHESPRRGTEFVTRKITSQLAEIKHGTRRTLTLGNLHAARDWGHAADYVDAMWRILQQPEPGDYVIGTGITHTVRDVLTIASTFFDLDYHDCVHISDTEQRPTDVDDLRADPTRATHLLGWTPTISFTDMIRDMCEHDEWAVTRDLART